MKDFDADLSAYLTLKELASCEENEDILEDITSKMRVHSNKLKDGSSGISFKW